MLRRHHSCVWVWRANDQMFSSHLLWTQCFWSLSWNYFLGSWRQHVLRRLGRHQNVHGLWLRSLNRVMQIACCLFDRALARLFKNSDLLMINYFGDVLILLRNAIDGILMIMVAQVSLVLFLWSKLINSELTRYLTRLRHSHVLRIEVLVHSDPSRGLEFATWLLECLRICSCGSEGFESQVCLGLLTTTFRRWSDRPVHVENVSVPLNVVPWASKTLDRRHVLLCKLLWLREVLIRVKNFIVLQELLGLLIDVNSWWQKQGVWTCVEARLPEGLDLVILRLVSALSIDLLLHDVNIYILDVVAILNTYHSFLVWINKLSASSSF